MELEAEVKALETKLRGVCQPEIFLEPRRFVSGDPAVLQRLVGRILQSGPLEVQQRLVEEGTYTPLCHFVGEDWYAVFSRFLRDNQGLLAVPGLPGPAAREAGPGGAPGGAPILPWDQWRRRSFAAVKVREVSLFVDILRKLVPQRRNLRRLEIERQNELRRGRGGGAGGERPSAGEGGAQARAAASRAADGVLSASSASVFGSGLGPGLGSGLGSGLGPAPGPAPGGAGAAPLSRPPEELPPPPSPPSPDPQEALPVESYQLRLRAAAEAAEGARASGTTGPAGPTLPAVPLGSTLPAVPAVPAGSTPPAPAPLERPGAYQLLLQIGRAVALLDEKLDAVLRRVSDIERRVSGLG